MNSLKKDVEWGEVVTNFDWRSPMPENVFRTKLLNELARIATALETLAREGKRERV